MTLSGQESMMIHNVANVVTSSGDVHDLCKIFIEYNRGVQILCESETHPFETCHLPVPVENFDPKRKQICMQMKCH